MNNEHEEIHDADYMDTVEELLEKQPDNICPDCDSAGTDEDGHLCKSCQGKGYR